MTQEAAETKPAATKATAKKTPRPKALTLQQKFIKLREAIPAIVKAKHSEGVEYKFAKISDVYRLLTPAMNEHGVNFDIVAETATRHTPEGDPLYYHYYTMNERGVQRTVWVYEEDLTIRWTNADNPEDILEVTLHAIGTNDGGPDKAKGSALTYCLKYYLFEKFGIDQGEDDPDMKNLTGAAQAQQAQPQAQNQGTTPQNSPAGRNTQQTGKPSLKRANRGSETAHRRPALPHVPEGRGRGLHPAADRRPDPAEIRTTGSPPADAGAV